MKKAAAWILALLGMGALGGAALWTLQARYERSRHTAPGSSYRSDARGARALFLLLEETGGRPRRLTRPLPPAGALLLSIEPLPQPPGRHQGLMHWLEEGGSLVLAGSGEAPVLRAVSHPLEKPVSLAGALGLALADREEGEHCWSRLPPGSRVLLGTREAPVLVSFPRGRGQVFALAEAAWLENGGLAEGGHLRLALDLLVAPGRPVAFDEYRHGLAERPGLGYVLARYGLLPAACAGLLLLGLLAWRASPRESTAPAGEPPAERVRDSLVDARAGLYVRALKSRELAELMEKDLRHGLAEALGERQALSWERLRDRACARRSALAPRLDGILAALEAARRRPPPDPRALLPLSRDIADLVKEVS